jgi:hypothetical protein
MKRTGGNAVFALNFQWPQNEELLSARKKDCTVRLGDIRDIYPENSIVWVTVGPKYGVKRKLYSAMIDTVYTKEFHALTLNDLRHQSPDIKTVEDLREYFQSKYQKHIQPEDVVTVIYFSEIIER